MLSAGQRNNRVRFERRQHGVKSASGNLLEEWSKLIERWAAFKPQFGREQIASGRLESTVIGVLTILLDPAALDVTAADRVLFLTGPYRGRIFAIVSAAPTGEGREIEMTLRSSDGTT